jgi:hypothetical protein
VLLHLGLGGDGEPAWLRELGELGFGVIFRKLDIGVDADRLAIR